jgi:hypothetical protein
MIWLMANWRFALIGILLATTLLAGALWRKSADDFAEYRAQVTALGNAQNAATEKLVEEQKQITKDIQDGYEASIAYLRSHPVRLRAQPGAGAMPGLSNPSTRADEASDYPIPAALELAAGCAETTNQLNFLQGWVEQQSGASK